MQELRPRETVILASDYEKLVRWYRDVLGMRVTDTFDDEFHYCCLKTASGSKLGIAPAAGVRVVPGDRSKNTVLLQLEVDDLHELFAHLRQADSVITFGPSREQQHGFWFSRFADPEGNPIWAVDKNCP